MIAWIVRLVARLFGFSPAVADDAAKLATDLRAQKTGATPSNHQPIPSNYEAVPSAYEGPTTRN